ncbi:MAG: hypothetical protein ACI35S_07710, partial [Anaeroplasma sp.]
TDTLPSTTTPSTTLPSTTLPSTTLPSTTLPSTTLPSTTTPSTTLPSTTTPSTTLPSTTLPSTTLPETSTIVKDNRPGYDYLSALDSSIISNFNAGGFVEGKIGDFSQYENTPAYRKVSTAEELLDAISDAKYHYKNVWNDATSTYTQVPADGYTEETMLGSVHVIEIMNDINMGYNKIDLTKVDSSTIENFSRKNAAAISNLTMSDMFTENGISQIKIENTSNLLVYSKNGAKLTHCGIKLTSDTNVVFRNLQFDEIWQWEDSMNSSPNFIIGDYDAFGWAYFKIAFCGYVWIDHCEFGKSYDGQIDYSNPEYSANSSVAFRAPFGADGGNGLHISNCRFNAGSDDKNGYLYQMMLKCEDDYNNNGGQYLYYKTLRDMGATFDEILYGIAIPQKKGFLLGDSGDDYNYNLKLKVSFANNVFMNIEDRIPKVRGGIAYLYNNIIDSFQYNTYRDLLLAKNIKNINSQNSKYKCALVSQGVICGLGAGVMAENTFYYGISDLLKNNDSYADTNLLKGGYKFINVKYQINKQSIPYIGTTEKTNHKYNNYNATPTYLTIVAFNWHNDSNTKPFEPVLYDLEHLDTILNNTFRSGINTNIADMYMYSNFYDYSD